MKYLLSFFLLITGCTFASAQYLRSSFLIDGHHSRMRINPALTPESGYVDIPLIGSLNFAASSNSLGVKDVIDAFRGESGGFIDGLYDRSAEQNRLNLNLNTDIVSVGFWQGDNFFSVNAGLRFDIGAQIPRSMFSLIKEVNNATSDSWKNFSQSVEKESMYLNAFSEIGVGMSRVFDENLVIGLRLKALLGWGNLNIDINRLSVETHNLDGDIGNADSWKDDAHGSIAVDATAESSLSGIKFVKDKDGMITDLEYSGFGIAGYGAALDFGLSYKMLDMIKLSAGVTDVGFISWYKNSTNVFSAQSNRYYDKNNYQEFIDIIEDSKLLNYELFGFQHGENTKARTTSLYSTIAAGAEFAFMDDKVAVGLLSTTRMMKPETLSELTFSAALRPLGWFNAAASYSFIEGGNTFGLALKLGPLFFGTDYMYLSSASHVANAYVGISVPLSGRNK